MPSNYLKAFPSDLQASGQITLNPGDPPKVFKGHDKRKLFMISNNGAPSITITDKNDVPFAVVWPSSTIAFETSADIKVTNTGGTALSFIVGEFFYENQEPPE